MSFLLIWKSGGRTAQDRQNKFVLLLHQTKTKNHFFSPFKLDIIYLFRFIDNRPIMQCITTISEPNNQLFLHR
jgi:hypothetical protein